MALVYTGDIGTRLTIATNNTLIALTTVLTLLLKKPAGTLLTKTPTVNYTTGVITYDSVSGDLDEVGEYIVQVRGVFDDGDDLRSDKDKFYVYEKLS